MIRYLDLLRRKWNRYWLLAQIEHIDEVLITTQQRRVFLYEQLRREQVAIAMRESAANLLTQALRSKR